MFFVHSQNKVTIPFDQNALGEFVFEILSQGSIMADEFVTNRLKLLLSGKVSMLPSQYKSPFLLEQLILKNTMSQSMVHYALRSQQYCSLIEILSIAYIQKNEENMKHGLIVPLDTYGQGNVQRDISFVSLRMCDGTSLLERVMNVNLYQGTQLSARI